MPQKTVRLLPMTLKTMEIIGNQIRMARLRRNCPVTLMTGRAVDSRTRVWTSISVQAGRNTKSEARVLAMQIQSPKKRHSAHQGRLPLFASDSV